MESPDKNNNENELETSSMIAASWNTAQEALLKGIAERSNGMRWLHNQSQTHFDTLNFYFTIPNVVITTVNGSITMSLNSLVSESGNQKIALTIIGLISIFAAILTTINQYIKSAQMAESHRVSAIAYGKLYRVIMNELALRRDQRVNSMDFLKTIRGEQDRLENSSPMILAIIIQRFNNQFANSKIEKPEITGDLDEVNINRSPTGLIHRVYSFVSSPFSKNKNKVTPNNTSSNNTSPNDENTVITIKA